MVKYFIFVIFGLSVAIDYRFIVFSFLCAIVFLINNI